MSVIGTISAIDIDGSGNTYQLRDPNAGSPLSITTTITAGSGGSIVFVSDDWANVNALETYCDVKGIKQVTTLDNTSQYKNVSITLANEASATQTLTFKVIGKII